MQSELLIRNATVYDGTGEEPYRASIAVDGGKIAAIARGGDGADIEGGEEIAAEDLALAPGFIDVHSHADWLVAGPGHADIVGPLLEQGVTTVVTGNCGFSPCPVEPDYLPYLRMSSEMIRDREIDFSWRTHAQFLDHLASQPLALNVAHLAGHGSIRLAVMGMRLTPAGTEDLAHMAEWVREAMEAGCVGLSTGLGYPPGMFADGEELVALARIAAEYGRLFTSHLRAYSWISPFFSLNPVGWRAHNLRAIDEILAVAKQANARLQISHLIYVGRRTWKTYPAALAAIERARDAGLDVAFDTFPYTAGNTTIRVIYPAWAQGGLPDNLARRGARARLRAELNLMQTMIGIHPGDIQLLWGAHRDLAEFEGLRFTEIGQRLGMDPLGAYFHVTQVSRAKARVMLFKYSGEEGNEEAMRATLAHPLNSIETDTILTTRGRPNPASFGTFPFFLGRYARSLGLVPLATAVRKMTGNPAARLGLPDRGLVREGYRADLTLFDPTRIDGPADFDQPDRRPRGIARVLINGVSVVRDGTYEGAYAGNLIRG